MGVEKPGSIRVLLVDDDREFLRFTQDRLAQIDPEFEIDIETDSTAVVDAFDQQEWDCVVSDYKMPRMNGLELFEELQVRAPDVPFLLLTGAGDESLASRAIEAGVSDYFLKSASKERLQILANRVRNVVTVAQEFAARDAREQGLQTLNRSTQSLLRATTRQEVFAQTIDAVTGIADNWFVGIYAFDTVDLDLELAAYEGPLLERFDRTLGSESDDQQVWNAFVANETMQFQRNPDAAADEYAGIVIPFGNDGLLVAGTTAPTDRFADQVDLIRVIAANAQTALDRIEYVETIDQRDATLQQQDDELLRRQNVLDLRAAGTNVLLNASTREEIEQRLCDHLVSIDSFTAVWTGKFDATTGTVTPTSWAGLESRYFEQENDVSLPDFTLAAGAAEDGQPAVVTSVLDTQGWEPRRTDALTHGFNTVAAVPLSSRARTVGVLVVYSTCSADLGEKQLNALEEIGAVVGYGIEERERSRALTFDTRTEVDIGFYDTGILFERLAERLSTNVTLDGCYQKNSGQLVLFLSVEDTDSENICTVIEELPEVETATLLLENDGATRIQVQLAEPVALFDILFRYGATLRTLTAESKTVTATVECPSSVSIRSLIDALAERYPYPELLARRDRPNDQEEHDPVSRALTELTDRQLEVLQTAYFAGFFEWPRPISGEELASMLDIAPPTFHQHLRTAERKVADALLGS